MSKKSITTIGNMIDEYKEKLNSADYKLVMDELGKLMVSQESADLVRLKVLKQKVILDNNSETLDSYSIISNLEERYFPLKIFRNHFGQNREDYICKFEDIKKHVGKPICLNKKLIHLICQHTESEVFAVCSSDCEFKHCDCKCVEINYHEYILVDCEIV